VSAYEAIHTARYQLYRFRPPADVHSIQYRLYPYYHRNSFTGAF